MRYVAFLLLLLLTLYFLFLKPYLISKKVLYGVKEVSFRISPFNLSVGNLYVYLPLSGRYVFLSLKDLSLSYEDKLKVSLSEGAFISVGEGSKTGGGGPVKIPVPEFLKESEIRVGKFLITIVGNKAVSVLLKNVVLRDRKLKGHAEIHAENFITFVSLERAYLRKESISVERARVWSDLFEFDIRGRIREADLKADFTLEGKVKGIRRGAVSVAPIGLRGSGRLDYEGLTLKLRGFTEKVGVEDRITLDDVRTDSDLRIVFGGEAYLRGRVWNETTSMRYELSLSPKMHLRAEVDRFPVDSKLLRIPYLVFGWVRGDVFYDFEESSLQLSVRADSLSVENFYFESGVLKLRYDLQDGKGDIYLSASDPGYLEVSGNFTEEGFEGKLVLERLFWAEGPLSLCLYYRGRVAYMGGLRLEGEGNFRDLSYSNFPVGDGSYELSLYGDRIELLYRGEGFSGYVKGDLKGGILSITDLKDLRRKVYGLDLRIDKGRVEFSHTGKGFTLGIRVYSGGFNREGVRGSFSGKLSVSKGKRLEGSYTLNLKDLEIFSKEMPEATLDGKLAGDTVKGSYKAGDVLEGDYTFNMDSKVLSTKGGLSLEGVNLLFNLEGSPERGKIVWSAELGKIGKPLRLTGRGEYFKDRYLLRIDPAVYERGAFRVSLGGVKLEGNMEKASLEVGAVNVYVMDRPAVRLSQRKGFLDLKERKFLWKGSFEGALEGDLDIIYSEGISFLSRGIVDLERLSFFIATPLGGKAEGKLRYSFSYKDGKLKLELRNAGKVITYSRFFSFPLEAWIDLNAVGSSLGAFITLWRGDSGLSANVGTVNLKDYYVYLVSRDLPVRYRSKGLNLSLRISSEGWVDVKDLKDVKVRLDALLSGDVEIGRLEKREKGKSKAPAVELDIRFESEKPIKITLPEGHVYANIRGWVSGSSADPRYGVEIELLSGELKYFGRTFFVKGGTISSLRDVEGESTRVDITLVSPGDELSIFLKVRGDLEDPQVVVWSEPPRSTQELLTKLIIGSTAEGVIPVAKALFKQLGYIGNVRSGLASLLGVEISFSTQTGSQGEIGFGVNVRKKIARAFAIEYQQSTLKDPRATYYGGSLSISRNFSFYGRVFSDRSSEIKLRFIRKFDF